MRLTWTFCFFSDTSIVLYCICFSVLIFFFPFYLKNLLKTLSQVRLEPCNRRSTHFPRHALVLAETGAQVPLDASASMVSRLGGGGTSTPRSSGPEQGAGPGFGLLSRRLVCAARRSQGDSGAGQSCERAEGCLPRAWGAKQAPFQSVFPGTGGGGRTRTQATLFSVQTFEVL